MVKVQLSDGVILRVDVELSVMQDAYEEALKSDQMLQITSADGTTRAVNPRQVLYFEANGNGNGDSSAPEASTLVGRQ